MRWSELAEREMIDIYNGARLGKIKQADMTVDPETGKLTELIVGRDSGFFAGFSGQQEMRIPWSAVKQIGPQIILIESPGKFGEEEVSDITEF